MTMTNDEVERRILALEAEVSGLRSRNQILGGAGAVPDAFRFGQGTPTVKEADHIISTIPVPVVPTVQVRSTGNQQTDFLRKSELTDEKIRELKLDHREVEKDDAAPLMEPLDGHDTMTQGELLLAIKKIKTAEHRDRVLAYERAHKNREVVVQALVNWNS